MDSRLETQLRNLLNSCMLYDRGESDEAKKIAVIIRTLLHDTNNSHSLLKQMELKDIKYIDSSYERNPSSITPYLV